MERDESHAKIRQLIQSGEPFWVARYGHTEMRFINAILYDKYVGKNTTPENVDVDFALEQLCNNAGFFPPDIKLGNLYVEAVLNAAPNIDIHAIWDLWMEEYLACVYEKNAQFMRWAHFAPYYLRKEDGIIPWTSALAGKKVLVINPFTDSIKKQYEINRTNLFSSIFDADKMLPEFELKTQKSVQTSGGNRDNRFSDWFEALEYMKEQINRIDFDVALIGCGAYGFLLADYIKSLGKGAIQSCGCTQMLFGVLGKRWTDDKRLMSEVVNSYWIRPSNDEKPEGFSNVEGGCYW